MIVRGLLLVFNLVMLGVYSGWLHHGLTHDLTWSVILGVAGILIHIALIRGLVVSWR